MHSFVTAWIFLTLCVTAALTHHDEIKQVFGAVGRSIVLQTALMADESQLLWSFGPEHHVLVNYTDGQLQSQTVDRFRGRIHLDTGSGSLTITDLGLNDTGLYYGQVINGAGSHDWFNLTIFDPAPMPGVKVSAVSSESCSLVCFVEKDDETVLFWYKGEKILDQTSTVPSLPLIVDKEALNSSYSCVAANPANNNTLSLNITALCGDSFTNDDGSASRRFIIRLLIVGITITTISVIVVIIKSKLKRTPLISSRREEEAHYTELVETTVREGKEFTRII